MKKQNTIIKQIFRDKNKWLNIIKSFGTKKDIAEEIFCCMIEQIYKRICVGLDISYGTGYNYWYVFRSLRGHFIDFLRKEKLRNKLHIRIDTNGEYCLLYDYTQKHRTNFPVRLQAPKHIDYQNLYKKSLSIIEQVQKTNSNLYKIKRHFEIYKQIDDGEMTISEYARLKKLPYYRCYSSYKISKKLLKEKICELEIN
tara:strand:+ start:3653 stop:4246 length:594 start_codon:yes stop_codon:yes gene_type:complete